MVLMVEHFVSEVARRESDQARQREWFIKARHDHQRREDMADKVDDAVSAVSTAVIVASAPQIKSFETKLETLDLATVQALMENQQLLDAVTARIDAMLGRAHVMGDGRRVFRTEDGTQVFDENGVEVSAEELDPDIIDPTAPKWEAFSTEVELRDQLIQDRTDIIEFQEKADAARVRIDGGDISETELADLEADLMDAMPDAVRSHAGLELRNAAPDFGGTIQPTTGNVAERVRELTDTGPAPAPM